MCYGRWEGHWSFIDQWLKNKLVLRLDQDHVNVHSYAKAYEYFKPERKEWDVKKIRDIFSADNAREILATRIPQNQRKDKVAWVNSMNGTYSAKSGYQFWKDQMNIGSNVLHSKGWSRIWSLGVPHKLKIILWRICRGNLQVRNMLRSRGVQSPIIFPMCSSDVEHMLHLFFDCHFA